MVSIYEKFKDEILSLNKQGKSNAEIGRLLGIDSRRVGDSLRKMNISPATRNYGEENPTDLQKDYLVANAIGDGCIFKDKKAKYHRMSLAHSLKQEEYFLHKYGVVKDFIDVGYKYESEYHKIREKTYTCIKYQSKTKPYFTELYNNWYDCGKKVIKLENVNQINERVLALKYFDDGYKSQSSYYIAMDDYDEVSLKVFMDHLLNEFGIKTNLHKRNRVYILAEYKDKLTDILKKYATSDVEYKIWWSV